MIDSINKQLETEAVVILAGHHDKADIPRMMLALSNYIENADHVIIPVSYLGYRHPMMKSEVFNRLYPNVEDPMDAKQMAAALEPDANPHGVEVYSAWRGFEEERFESGELTAEERTQGQSLFKLYVRRTQRIFRNPQKYPRTVIVVAPSARMTNKGEQSLDALYNKLQHGISMYCMSLEWTPRVSPLLADLFLAEVRLYQHQWRLNDPKTYYQTKHWSPWDETSLERANAEIDEIYERIEQYGQREYWFRAIFARAGALALNMEQVGRDIQAWLRTIQAPKMAE
jgi:hypothetical protein